MKLNCVVLACRGVDQLPLRAAATQGRCPQLSRVLLVLICHFFALFLLFCDCFDLWQKIVFKFSLLCVCLKGIMGCLNCNMNNLFIFLFKPCYYTNYTNKKSNLNYVGTVKCDLNLYPKEARPSYGATKAESEEK